MCAIVYCCMLSQIIWEMAAFVKRLSDDICRLVCSLHVVPAQHAARHQYQIVHPVDLGQFEASDQCVSLCIRSSPPHRLCKRVRASSCSRKCAALLRSAITCVLRRPALVKVAGVDFSAKHTSRIQALLESLEMAF